MKLALHHYGPFPIVKVISPVAYKLQLPDQWQIHNIFHIDLLLSYMKIKEYGLTYEWPPPNIIEGSE